MTVKVADKEYSLALRMFAVRAYAKATGKDLLHGEATFDIFGNGKDKQFNIELFMQFLYACMTDGAKPAALDITFDQFADHLSTLSFPELEKLAVAASMFFIQSKYGYSDEEMIKFKEEAFEKLKNPTAPSQSGQS